MDAILPCRNGGTRLYGKPLQPLEIGGATILDSLIEYVQAIPSVRHIVLAIAEGDENRIYADVAKKHGIMHFFGDEGDVLGRILQGIELTGADYIFHTSTECPFVLHELADDLIQECIAGGYDRASHEQLPDGVGFQIFKSEALRISHRDGDDKHRRETVALYMFEHKHLFKFLDKPLPSDLRRIEVRLTVDYAEDLVFCQQVYQSLKKDGLIPVRDIVAFWDENPELRKPLEEIGTDWGKGRLWS